MTEPRITRRKITEYAPDSQNANKGTERGHRILDDSVTELGLGRSVLADKHGTLIGGNKTQQAAVDNGFEDAIEIETDGKTLVVVRRTDLDLNDANPNNPARRMAFFDNRVGQLNLNWSAEQLLSDMQSGVDLSKLWTPDELAELLAGQTDEPVEDPGAQIDRAGELQKIWQVQRGDVWHIGKHWLMCGDSTSAEDVARLMDDTLAQFSLADPPYNVGIDYGDSTDDKKDEIDYLDWSLKWFKITRNYTTHSILVTPGMVSVPMWIADIERTHFILAWIKENNNSRNYIGKTSGFQCWEPMLVFGKSHTTVLRDTYNFPISHQSDAEGHPVPKPLSLWVKLVEDFSDSADAVYDPFCGSGTTLVACEQTGRRGFGMEIAPEYCAVILQRLKDCGLSPERAS